MPKFLKALLFSVLVSVLVKKNVCKSSQMVLLVTESSGNSFMEPFHLLTFKNIASHSS